MLYIVSPYRMNNIVDFNWYNVIRIIDRLDSCDKDKIRKYRYTWINLKYSRSILRIQLGLMHGNKSDL